MGKLATRLLAAGLAAVTGWTTGCTHASNVVGPLVTDLRVKGDYLEVTECELGYEETDSTGAAVALLIVAIPLILLSGGRGGGHLGGGGGKHWKVEQGSCSAHWVKLPSPGQGAADEPAVTAVRSPAPEPELDPCVDPISRWLEIREVAHTSRDRARRVAAKRLLRKAWSAIPAQCRVGLEESK